MVRNCVGGGRTALAGMHPVRLCRRFDQPSIPRAIAANVFSLLAPLSPVLLKHQPQLQGAAEQQWQQQQQQQQQRKRKRCRHHRSPASQYRMQRVVHAWAQVGPSRGVGRSMSLTPCPLPCSNAVPKWKVGCRADWQERSWLVGPRAGTSTAPFAGLWLLRPENTGVVTSVAMPISVCRAPPLLSDVNLVVTCNNIQIHNIQDHPHVSEGQTKILASHCFRPRMP